MLTVQENERLTRVDGDAPMGRLFRYYWHPIAASSEMWEKGTKPVRLLGEDLVLFRDQRGNLGLIERYCAHRRTDLAVFGICEQDGLRCSFHGWKYDETGRCMEQPYEDRTHPEDNFRTKATRKSYSVQEFSGLVWAYLGPKPEPLLPMWSPLLEENAVRDITFAELPCNWLQARETNVDPVHVEFVHVYLSNYAAEVNAGTPWQDRHPESGLAHVRLGFDEFEYGIIKRRVMDGTTENDDVWKVGHPNVFPTMLVTGTADQNPILQYHVPIDDTHTLNVTYYVYKPVPGHQAPRQESVPYRYVPLKDDKGEWIIDKVFNQDYTSWAAQGPLMDRSQEVLGESDRGVILFRRQLQQQLRIVEEGSDPMNVFRDPAHNVRLEVPLEGLLTHTSGQMAQQQSTTALATSFEAGESAGLDLIVEVLETWQKVGAAPMAGAGVQ